MDFPAGAGSDRGARVDFDRRIRLARDPVRPTDADQQGAAWNGHCDCICEPPNFLFNPFGQFRIFSTDYVAAQRRESYC
jgi:hypothetical protein